MSEISISREEAIKDIQENVLPCVGGKSLRIAISDMEKLEKIEQILNTYTRNSIGEIIDTTSVCKEIEQIVKGD